MQYRNYAVNQSTKRLFRDRIKATIARINAVSFISIAQFKIPPVAFNSFPFRLLLFTARYRGAHREMSAARANRLCRQRWSSPSKAHRAFSEGERGGSSFAGVMVHTAHSRRLEKRKPRAKRAAREESSNACDYADQWAMALFMALSGSLYRARRFRLHPSASWFFFIPNFFVRALIR